MPRALFGSLLALTLIGCGAPVPAPTPTDLSNLDCNRDGGLSLEEVRPVWINQSGGGSRPITNAEFQQADRDGNGRLSLSELSGLLTTVGSGWGFSGGCR